MFFMIFNTKAHISPQASLSTVKTKNILELFCGIMHNRCEYKINKNPNEADSLDALLEECNL